MSVSCRRSLPFFFSFAAIVIFSAAAYAGECDTDCDPYTTHCGAVCQICSHYTQDGCDRWRNSTCGDQAIGCVADGCTPNCRSIRDNSAA